MNEATLKISKEMWNEIDSGHKDREIRKLNKDYIQEGWTISFIDMVTGDFLGKRNVFSKKYWLPRSVINFIGHQQTISFVKANYMKESKVIVFKLEKSDDNVFGK